EEWMVRSMSQLESTIWAVIRRYDVPADTDDAQASFVVSEISPVATTIFVPSRTASADGQPAAAGVGRQRPVSVQELEVLRYQEDKARQRQERDRDRPACRGEAGRETGRRRSLASCPALPGDEHACLHQQVLQR